MAKNDTIYKTDTIKYYSGVKLVHDTIFVTQPDTIYVFKDVKFVHDTIKTEVLVHDTVIYYKDVKFVHDTIYITKTDTIYLQTAVSEVNAIGLKVYPNPTYGLFTIEGVEVDRIQLFDVYGKLLKNSVLSDGEHQIDMSDFTNGVYILKAYYHNNVVGVKKIIKQ